jgi:hypothetical protein
LNPGAGLRHYKDKDTPFRKDRWKIAAMDNSTIPAADRTTHAKIVAISLAASVAVGLVGMMARSPAVDANAHVQAAGPAVKAGRPVAVSHSDMTVIR